jgi:hypothetical protein
MRCTQAEVATSSVSFNCSRILIADSWVRVVSKADVVEAYKLKLWARGHSVDEAGGKIGPFLPIAIN